MAPEYRSDPVRIHVCRRRDRLSIGLNRALGRVEVFLRAVLQLRLLERKNLSEIDSFLSVLASRQKVAGEPQPKGLQLRGPHPAVGNPMG